jgi:MbtH protein
MENQANYLFTVVINHERQYSIWPAGQTIPQGWRSIGQLGSKEACLAYIDWVWTDRTPLHLRTSEPG